MFNYKKTWIQALAIGSLFWVVQYLIIISPNVLFQSLLGAVSVLVFTGYVYSAIRLKQLLMMTQTIINKEESNVIKHITKAETIIDYH